MQRGGPTGEYVLHRKDDQKVGNKTKRPVLKGPFQEHTALQHLILREEKSPKSHHAHLVGIPYTICLYYLSEAAVTRTVTMFFYLVQRFLQYLNAFSVKYSPTCILAVIIRSIKGVSVMLQFEITKILGKISIIHVQQKSRERKRKKAHICTLICFMFFSFVGPAF